MSAAAPDPSEPGGAAAFPWDEAMALCFGTFRLSPRDFWALSPRELAALARPLGRRSAAPTRERLDALLQLYPDRR
ncbi:phage tail assembly chaperone [Aureimonas ureilytica]|uniref:phage tail assembly chaperone n=1 Tax=Aureimonas ureilytica TaxID=401562 RepID=UPI0003748CE7|nr:phage tail assembly chaperone [Aureimonas ureilytica]